MLLVDVIAFLLQLLLQGPEPPCRAPRCPTPARSRASRRHRLSRSLYRLVRWRQRQRCRRRPALRRTGDDRRAPSAGSGDSDATILSRLHGSDPALCNMPVSFENSALKMSFSLSSLPPSSDALEGPEHANVERPYNSLTKKPRRESEKEAWRRSWGSRDDSRDDFWAALQSNYNYLMDNQLIDTCKEASGELSWDEQDVSQQSWSFSEFVSQFSELYSWLNRIQEAAYSKEEHVADKSSRQVHMEELQRRWYRRKLFNEQGHQLTQSCPDTREEVAWRLATLNSRWDMLEQTFHSNQEHHLDPSLDMEQEVRCLRRWIRDMEARLHPLEFRTGLSWSLQELEEKAREHVVLQVDIVSHGKVVCSVVKLCERVACASHHSRRDAAHALRLARSLERRWHHLYLRAIEWQCHIEGLADRLRGFSPSGASASDSDEEPVPKCPRLSGDISSDHLTEDESYFEDELEELSVMDTSPSSALQTDDDTNMVGTTERTTLVNGNCNAADLNDNYKSTTSLTRQDDDLRFDMSTRRKPNFGSFYFRHHDTDSEQDRGSAGLAKALTPQKLCPVVSGIDESSDEEWTYREGGEWKGEACDKASSPEEVFEVADKQPPRETIVKLVKEADELVREEVTTELELTTVTHRVFEPLVFTADTKTKSRRVRDWLRLHPEAPMQLQDSCDASGEYTTGDSDDEKGSDTSEDHNGSVSTCRQLPRSVTSSAEAFQDTDTTPIVEKPLPLLHPSPDHPKVVMRCRRQLGSGDRPWSVSGLSQLGVGVIPTQDIVSFSISESALHQLLSPATPTAATALPPTEENASSSLRRRKVRTRRRTLGRKSDSGGSGGGSGGSDTQQKKVEAALTNGKAPMLGRNKSGSFSGSPSVPRVAVVVHSTSEPVVLVGSTSGEEDGEALSPKFKLGPGEGLVTMDPGAGLAEEQMSSFSEQAWDNYQEKYMSEPYSEELADSEEARRLLEFGDDYRNYMDSQSDCMSSLSTNHGAASPVRRRRPTALAPPDNSVLDSDSDVEEIQHLVQHTFSQLFFTENVLSKLSSKKDLALPTDFAEIVATSKENIRCLRPILVDVGTEGGMLTLQQCHDLRDVVVRWERVQLRAEEMQQARTLERDVAAIRDDMVALASRVTDVGELQDRDQLEARIRHVESAMTQMVNKKSSLLKLNMAVHHFHTSLSGETDQQPALALKESIAELYKVWDETYKSMSQYLSSLLQASETWKLFDVQLVELQTALRSDQVTLRVLDSAVQGSGPSPDITSSIREVAKVLSEKQAQDTALGLQEMEVLDDAAMASLTLRPGEGGSLSDSGISDSGSEQEMSEREKRLAVLRRLARNLEAVLSPGCTALVNILRRIEQTEQELKNLRSTCRDLIFRTAVKGRSPGDTVPSSSAANHVADSRARKRNGAVPNGVAPGADPEDPDGGRKFLRWVWRVIKASFPFQVALLALLCFVCLVEPRCCDAMNNFGLSFGPQLRYVRGPPPV